MKNILRLGFNTYGDYLKSNLWISIRNKILKANPKCAICKKKSQCVHHKNYDYNTLKGVKLGGLVALCMGCHYKIEFHNGKKMTLAQANKRLKKLRKKLRRTNHDLPYKYKFTCRGCNRNLFSQFKNAEYCIGCTKKFK